MAEENGLVYSTELGRINEIKPTVDISKGDGIIRIQRQTSGRKGKGVCIISGFELNDNELARLTSELKKKCGCGGALKNRTIEIQGDKKEELKRLLEEMNFKVKFIGG